MDSCNSRQSNEVNNHCFRKQTLLGTFQQVCKKTKYIGTANERARPRAVLLAAELNIKKKKKKASKYFLP